MPLVHLTQFDNARKIKNDLRAEQRAFVLGESQNNLQQQPHKNDMTFPLVNLSLLIMLHEVQTVIIMGSQMLGTNTTFYGDARMEVLGTNVMIKMLPKQRYQENVMLHTLLRISLSRWCQFGTIPRNGVLPEFFSYHDGRYNVCTIDTRAPPDVP